MFSMAETILVTGGSGFLGGHLAASLYSQGYRVVVFDLRMPEKDSAIDWLWRMNHVQVEFVQGDVSEFEFVKASCEKYRIDSIVHTAVINNLDVLSNNVPLSLKVNTLGSVNVLEAAKLSGIKKIIMTSSISVYAPRQYEPMDEKHPVHLPDEGPTLLSYSGTKLAAEALGMHYWATHGIDFIALRLSAVYGLGMVYPMYIKPIVENAAENRGTHFDWGKDAKRDYTYVADVVQGVLLALKANPKTRIFNVSAGGELRSAAEIGAIISEINPQVKVTFEDKVNEVEERTVKTRGILSIENAKNELGYRPQYPLEKGVQEYYEFYKRFLASGKEGKNESCRT